MLLATTSAALSLTACVGGPLSVDDYAGLTSYDDLVQSIDGKSELQQALSAIVTRTMRPGETVAGWSKTGRDFDELIEAAPGGSDANVLMNVLDGRVIFSSEKPLRGTSEDGYSTIISSGSSTLFSNRSESISYTLIQVVEGVWLETAENVTKIDNASCTSAGADAVRIHARTPFTNLTKLEKSYLASFLTSSRRSGGTICAIAEPTGPAVWRSRFFLPDGTRLPVFDREGGGKLTIVPITEANRMISGAA